MRRWLIIFLGFFVYLFQIFTLTCIRPLPAPSPVSLEAPADNAILNSSEVTFLWQDVADGEIYVLEVAEDAKFKSIVVTDSTSENSTSVNLKTDGSYWWRVRVQNEKGVWSEWSETRSFVIQRFIIVNSLKTQGYPHDITVQGNRAYIADGQAGLAVYDITNPVSPLFLARIMDSLNVAWGVAVKDSFAYIAYGYKELMIVNIQNPESLKIVGVLEYPQPGYGYDIAVQDTWAYIAAGAQFLAVNIADPRYPNLRFQYYYPRNCRSVVIADHRGFVACEQLGVAAWRLDTFPPVQLSGFDTPGNARGVTVNDARLYVADGRDGLMVIDAHEPGNLRELSRIALDGYANSVTVDDSLIFIACGSGGVAVVNCANPSEPYLMAQIKTPYAYGVGVVTETSYFLVLDRDLGIVTVKKEF